MAETKIHDLKNGHQSFDVTVDLQNHVLSLELWSLFNNALKNSGGHLLGNICVFPEVHKGGVIRLKGLPTIERRGGRLSTATVDTVDTGFSEETDLDYDLSQQVGYDL